MAESTVGLDEGSTTTAGCLTDGSGNKVIKHLPCHDNGSAVPVNTSQADPLPTRNPGVSSATESSASVSTSSAQVLASNSSRVGGFIVNYSDTDIYVSFGATASSSTTKINKNGGSLSLVIDGVNCYTGQINAVHAGSGSKTLTIVEL